MGSTSEGGCGDSRGKTGSFRVTVSFVLIASLQPTLCHYFIRLLKEKGLLLRCYTQVGGPVGVCRGGRGWAASDLAPQGQELRLLLLCHMTCSESFPLSASICPSIKQRPE